MTWYEPVARLALALALGSLIGFERQYHQRAAGLRTNALVATGSALFVMVSTLTPGERSPTRVAAQVASGIGFLGGGVILREGFSIRGLNTAATLWCAAAVGSLAGCGIYALSTFGTVAVVIANLGLRPLALLVNTQAQSSTETDSKYQCLISCEDGKASGLRSLLHEHLTNGPLQLREFALERCNGTVHLRAILYSFGDRDDSLIDRIVGVIAEQPGVTAASWSVLEGHNDSI